jgi:ankyrin repeat protein
LHYASAMGNVEAVDALIAGKADVDSISYKRVDWRLLKQTALSLAIGFKQTEPTGALRKAGAETRKPIYDIYHRVKRKGMEKLLNRAVRQKFPDFKAIQIGLNAGASPNDRDDNLQNPLHFLSHTPRTSLPTMSHLIAKGADPKATDGEGIGLCILHFTIQAWEMCMR